MRISIRFGWENIQLIFCLRVRERLTHFVITGLQDLGKTEVSDLEGEIPVQQTVSGRQVSVHHAPPRQVGHAVRRLHRHLQQALKQQ